MIRNKGLNRAFIGFLMLAMTCVSIDVYSAAPPEGSVKQIGLQIARIRDAEDILGLQRYLDLLKNDGLVSRISIERAYYQTVEIVLDVNSIAYIKRILYQDGYIRSLRQLKKGDFKKDEIEFYYASWMF